MFLAYAGLIWLAHISLDRMTNSSCFRKNPCAVSAPVLSLLMCIASSSAPDPNWVDTSPIDCHRPLIFFEFSETIISEAKRNEIIKSN